MVCNGSGSTYRWLCWTFRQMAATVRDLLDQLLVSFLEMISLP